MSLRTFFRLPFIRFYIGEGSYARPDGYNDLIDSTIIESASVQLCHCNGRLPILETASVIPATAIPICRDVSREHHTLMEKAIRAMCELVLHTRSDKIVLC